MVGIRTVHTTSETRSRERSLKSQEGDREEGGEDTRLRHRRRQIAHMPPKKAAIHHKPNSVAFSIASLKHFPPLPPIPSPSSTAPSVAPSLSAVPFVIEEAPTFRPTP